jgi:hypothetical protein
MRLVSNCQKDWIKWGSINDSIGNSKVVNLQFELFVHNSEERQGFLVGDTEPS